MNTPELIRTGASLNRGGSRQDYETPPDFMAAIERRFGPPTWDLAATAENKKAPSFFSPEQDSLQQDWSTCFGTLWLNPPFDHIAPWVEKCDLTVRKNGKLRILFLTPASVGSNWFASFVHRKAMVYFLNGRLRFVGTDAPYPKDCILSVFGTALSGMDKADYDVWKWK